MCFAFPHALRKMRSLEQFQTLPCFLLCAACFLLFCTSASAAPPQAPIPPQAPDLPARVTALEQRVTALENACQCFQAVQPRGVATTSRQEIPGYRAVEQTVQVCRDGKCSLEKIVKYVPVNQAGSFPSSSTPQTFGQFIYDPDSDASPSPQTGPSGQTSAPAPTPFVRVPFRPIHNLIGRIRERRGGGTQSSRGGCSTCGN